ncbi:MAG: DUF3616 domain-containing protein [Cyanobacteria bacterium]|nr:DUF3616 domain-containing protein [Cyanobacteriota bacterium]MDA0865453.1 DUF3616 domain-containing protein [Cyanobacteriota bacterium]
MALSPFTLQFEHQAELIRADLSAVSEVGPHLWLGCDETATLERLTLAGKTASDHRQFAIGNFLPLPNGAEQEVDVEGLAYGDGYLWFVGSHSLKRRATQSDNAADQNLKRLGQVVAEANRYTLGRIPLVDGELWPQCPHPERAGEVLTAAQLAHKKGGNQLTRALEKDQHLGPFLQASIPGKDNGFDIEGLALVDHRLFIGLRGPVLRGWAILLEIQPELDDPGVLKLKKLEGKQRYRKYFLKLDGLGIRDLCVWGDQLLILAGPTMDLSGSVRLFQLPQAALVPQETLLEPTLVSEVPYGQGCDRPEGITLLTEHPDQLLVVYDAPAPERLVGAGGIRADRLSL